MDMEPRHSFDASALDLAMHDLVRCADLCRTALSEQAGVPAAARGEIVICQVACEIASEKIRRTAVDRQDALEFCEDACRRCVDALAGAVVSGDLALCARMADLCGASLRALLYDEPFG
jgi:hypothetical protein